MDSNKVLKRQYSKSDDNDSTDIRKENDISIITSIPLTTSKCHVTLRRVIFEDHRPLQIYCVKFCDIIPFYSSYFASVGSNMLSIYEIYSDYSIRYIQSLVDEDTEEIFYSCIWSSNDNDQPLLISAGLRGIIKVFNCITFTIDSILIGHGSAINDMKNYPKNHNFIFSASKDESIRLWNIQTSTCVAIFAGDKGHHDEVLCIDIHILGNCFVSGGMDTTIKIWNLEDEKIQKNIELSKNYQTNKTNDIFPTITCQIPLFSTTQVHNDYIDSIRFVGNCILSKSTKNRVVLWAPDSFRYKGAPLILREYTIYDSNLWFVRMDICIPLDLLAVGNKKGQVFLYNLSSDNINENSNYFKHKKIKKQSSSSDNNDSLNVTSNDSISENDTSSIKNSKSKVSNLSILMN